MPDRITTTVDGRTVPLSHLDKVLWPPRADPGGATGFAGFTKGDALYYYAQVAPFLLPHLRGRAATFVRFPAGVDGERFYAKNPPKGLPEWVTTVDVPSKEGPPSPYVCVDGLPTLMTMANLYALELHVPQWTAATGPGRHDRLVVDLDPGPGAALAECCAVALTVRDELAEDGLSAHAKTSGGKGLHVYAGVPPTGADDVVAYARGLAERLEARDPARVVSRMAKAERGGRVFVDWSQNVTRKTTAAPYTLRAAEQPWVSTPVTWDEVAQCADGGGGLAFLPGQVLERVGAFGDLMAGLFQFDAR